MKQENQTTDIRALMLELFESLPDEPSQADLVTEAQRIRQIASTSEETALFKRSKDKFDEFTSSIEEDTPEQERLMSSWIWLLNRINSAPTNYHMHGAVVLCMPIIARYLPPSD